MPAPDGHLQPDIRELILCNDDRYVCDTYIFEPSEAEGSLGYLFAVAETESREGVGRELLDLVITAIQREYYRDRARGAVQSFELALHQANLILHDASEQGIRDWMGYFNAAVGVLSGEALHISCAGEASALLVRKMHASVISDGLGSLPITNPLRTFSQVASGTLAPRDTLFLGTGHFQNLFHQEDLVRLAVEHSAATVATRLQQLYADQGSTAPLSLLVTSILPQYIVSPPSAVGLSPPARRTQAVAMPEALRPRQPIKLHYSQLQAIASMLWRYLGRGAAAFRGHVWPLIEQGSRQGGRAILRAGVATGRQVKRLGSQSTGQAIVKPKLSFMAGGMRGGLRRVINRLVGWPFTFKAWFARLPRTSRIFAYAAGIFAIALIASLILLQHKRANDAEIVRASELLHQAQTKKEAAEAALVYDNRDQATGLLTEASDLTGQVAAMGLYASEVAALQSEIERQHDRLQRIVRPASSEIVMVGDFSSVLGSTIPAHLWVLADSLYTANPENNVLARLTLTGEASLATQASQGIGFFTRGASQAADNTIVLATNAPGIALFDANDATIHQQDISLPQDTSDIGDIAVFGNRLYVYDRATKNIHSYNKTLRGFAGGEGWITDPAFPRDSITALAIDGNVFTLHSDGGVRRLFKGAAAELTSPPLAQSLSSATRLITSESYANIYVIDPTNHRVVVLTKEGELVQQIFIDEATAMRDAAVSSDEQRLFILDGTRVLAVPLTS